MKLTSEEKDMLAGKYGEGIALAMEIQQAIGEAFEAERMVEISRVHVALSNQEADLWFVEKLLKKGNKCRISPTVNPPYNLEYFKNYIEFTQEEVDIIERTRKAYREIGATLTYNCTPYLENNIPRFKEVVAFSESSATPYINSIYGARTNRESAQSALCAAMTGRVPEYGLLLEENRRGQVLVEVEAKIKSDFDYQLLGYTFPRMNDYHDTIPVFVGLPDKISSEALMNLGAQLNTAGAVSLYHIVGYTPEAPNIKAAFQNHQPRNKMVIKDEDIQETYSSISDKKGEIDFALFGCPHLTIKQIEQIVNVLGSRKFSVPFWVCVSNLTKSLARKMGYLDTIKSAGGHLVTETCIDQPCWKFLSGKKGVTDSPKCAYYTKRRNMSFYIADLSRATEAAIKGELR